MADAMKSAELPAACEQRRSLFWGCSTAWLALPGVQVVRPHPPPAVQTSTPE